MQRTRTPRGWVTRSTFLDRCLWPGPAARGSSFPLPLRVHLPGGSIFLSCRFHVGACGAVHGEVEKGTAQSTAGRGAQPELVSPSLVPLQTRDWNEELQTTRELPRKNLPERLLRERAIFKVPTSPGA